MKSWWVTKRIVVDWYQDSRWGKVRTPDYRARYLGRLTVTRYRKGVL